MKIGSSFLKKPQTRPAIVPKTMLIALLIKAKMRDLRKPAHNMKYKSLPTQSVPKKWTALGAWLAMLGLVSTNPAGVKRGMKIVPMIKTAKTERPMIADGFLMNTLKTLFQ